MGDGASGLPRSSCRATALLAHDGQGTRRRRPPLDGEGGAGLAAQGQEPPRAPRAPYRPGVRGAAALRAEDSGAAEWKPGFAPSAACS